MATAGMQKQPQIAHVNGVKSLFDASWMDALQNKLLLKRSWFFKETFLFFLLQRSI